MHGQRNFLKRLRLTNEHPARYCVKAYVGRIGAYRKGNARLQHLYFFAMPNIEIARSNRSNISVGIANGTMGAAGIRAMLPRFSHLGDEDILCASFRLADAQELVARNAGFDGRQAPISGADAMKRSKQAASPYLNATQAQLYVADVDVSCAFFTSKLNFSIAFVYGDPPFYGQVYRDNAFLNLRMVSEPVFAGDIREREHLLSASITVETTAEIKELYLDFQASGVHFFQTLKKEPWGARTFSIMDPDGNLVLFAGPAE